MLLSLLGVQMHVYFEVVFHYNYFSPGHSMWGKLIIGKNYRKKCSPFFFLTNFKGMFWPIDGCIILRLSCTYLCLLVYGGPALSSK